MSPKELAKLFPDPTVCKAVERVSNNQSSDAEEMENDYALLNAAGRVVIACEEAICFSNLAEEYRDHPDSHYLRYYIVPDGSLVSQKKALRWVELCQELGLLGGNQTPQETLSRGLLLNLRDSNMFVGKLYMQLCLFRWLREAPVLVNNVLDLVDNAGRDFWAAVTFCHAHNVSNVDHSLLPFSQGIYPVYGWDRTAFRNFALVLRLHEAAATPESTDCRRISVAFPNSDNFSWNWHDSTVKPPKKFVLKEREMLLSGELFPLLGANSYDEAEELVTDLT